MSHLVAASIFAAILLAITALAQQLMRRRGLPDDPAQLAQVRTMSTAWSGTLVPAAFAVVAFVGAVALVAHDEPIGFGWLVPTALFGLTAAGSWRHRRWLGAELGDRGRVARSERWQRRDRLARGCLAAGAAGALGSQVLRASLVGDAPSWSVALTGLFSFVFVVGFVGWLAVRTLMYAQGDDLGQSER